jgi:hypothetical protein
MALLVGLPLIALTVGLAWAMRTPDLPALLPPPKSPALPDLAMSPLIEISASSDPEGHETYIEFTATVSNVGRGALLIHAVRPDQRGRWRISQRFDEPDGSLSERVTPGNVVWGGHGHDHWHVHMGASYALTRPDSTEPLRLYDKVGFCFFDQRRLVTQPPTAPSSPRFPKTGCNFEDALEFTMGLSPGWGDPYSWTLPDQRLSVGGLEDGVYRLRATADPGGWFRESDETNNDTWVDLRLTLSQRPPKVQVVRRGPAGASAWVAG